MAGRLPTATCFPSRCSAGALVNFYGVTPRMRDCRITHTQNTPTCADCAAIAPTHISRHLSAWTERVYLITFTNRWLAASYSRHTELVSRACTLAASREWYRAAKLFLSISRKHGCGKVPKLEGPNEATQRRVSWKHPQTVIREYEKEKNEETNVDGQKRECYVLA